MLLFAEFNVCLSLFIYFIHVYLPIIMANIATKPKCRQYGVECLKSGLINAANNDQLTILCLEAHKTNRLYL